MCSRGCRLLQSHKIFLKIQWDLKHGLHCTALVITASTTLTSSSSPLSAVLAYHQLTFHHLTMMTPSSPPWNSHFPRQKSSSHDSRLSHDQMNFHSRMYCSASPTRTSRGLICFGLLLIRHRSSWNLRIVAYAHAEVNSDRHDAEYCDSWARRQWTQYRWFHWH